MSSEKIEIRLDIKTVKSTVVKWTVLDDPFPFYIWKNKI